MPVIDASVYVALLNADEPDHERSWAWFRQAIAADEPVVAPAILLPEVAAALSRGVSDPALARRVLDQPVASRLVELVPVTLPLVEQAAGIAAGQRFLPLPVICDIVEAEKRNFFPGGYR